MRRLANPYTRHLTRGRRSSHRKFLQAAEHEPEKTQTVGKTNIEVGLVVVILRLVKKEKKPSDGTPTTSDQGFPWISAPSLPWSALVIVIDTGKHGEIRQ